MRSRVRQEYKKRGFMYSCRRKRHRLAGSMTVECAFALPLFLFAVITLAGYMMTIGIQVRENLSLSGKARKLAMYAGAAGSGDSDIWIDLPKTCTFRYPGAVFGPQSTRIAVRARVHSWTGYAGEDDASGDDAGASVTTVYVTENREVYHTHADCTHLDLTVMRTDLANVKNMRNAYGRRYKKCKGFPDNYTGPVYLTEKGDYYYPSSDYNSLIRHVSVTDQSECGGLCLCERCAARDQKEAA
ncbi:MAG: hypothetical protein J6D46_00195 [Lachnospiraceae bacterium]|nr:hypothetical protein [Lachnospiraceae bacterium]